MEVKVWRFKPRNELLDADKNDLTFALKIDTLTLYLSQGKLVALESPLTGLIVRKYVVLDKRAQKLAGGSYDYTDYSRGLSDEGVYVPSLTQADLNGGDLDDIDAGNLKAIDGGSIDAKDRRVSKADFDAILSWLFVSVGMLDDLNKLGAYASLLAQRGEKSKPDTSSDDVLRF